jgi:dTDP-L-rhamnose 4-epimerase
MRCLITGGAGFIGSFLAEELLSRGHHVILLDNLTPQVHPTGAPAYLPANAQLVIGDVRDRAALQPLVAQADAVVHLAAAVGVAQSQYQVRHYCDVNVTGTATLCDILIGDKHRVRKVVLAASMTQYGEGVYRRPGSSEIVRPALRSERDVANSWEPLDRGGAALEPVPTDESATLRGENVYSQTKTLAEQLVLNLDRLYDIPAISLRLFNVYGPRQSLSNPYTGVLAIFISQILNGRAPVVFEDGGQTRDFIHVLDVARALADAATGPARGCCVNIGSGVATSISLLARQLCEALNPALTPEISGIFRRGDVRHCTADHARAADVLRFSPRISLEAGLQHLVQWASAQPSQDRTSQSLAELMNLGLATTTSAQDVAA